MRRDTRNRLVEAFCDMVHIDSESGSESEFLAYLQDILVSNLRAACAFDEYGNLVAKIAAKNTLLEVPILLGMHADTVKPGRGIEPVLRNGIIYSKGSTVLGADDKAGIAEVLEAVRGAECHPPLQLVITREEELGLQGAKHLDMSLITARFGFVVDMDAIDVIVIGGPSKVAIDVRVAGRAAHAGMEPEKGISAIRAACHAVVMLKEGRLDPETTVNVGVFEGGENRNGVPEFAELKLECRSFSHTRCIKQGKHMASIFKVAAEAAGAKLDVHSDVAYKASRLSADSLPVRVAREAMLFTGVTPQLQVIWGGTDASVYNARGIETAVIGTGARREHSTKEHVSADDMVVAVRVIQRALQVCCELSPDDQEHMKEQR